MSKKIKLEIKEEPEEVEEQLRNERIKSSDLVVKDENESKIRIPVPTELGDCVLYCIGGWIERYDRRTRRKEYTPQPSISYLCNSLTTPTWTTIPWPNPRVYCGAVVHDDKIFIFGGFKTCLCHLTIESLQKETILDTIEVFDLRNKTWLPERKLPLGIAAVGVCPLGEHIYTCGGIYSEKDNVSEVYNIVADVGGLYRYCPISERFELKSKPVIDRLEPILLALDGHLYLLSADDVNHTKAFMRRYEPLTDRWTDLTPMSGNHKYVTAVVHRGKIYVLGGYGLEVYRPDNDQWTKLAGIPGENNNGVLASINGRLISVGNRDLPRSRKIYEFDFEAAVWIRKKDMNCARSHCSVLVYDPSVGQ